MIDEKKIQGLHELIEVVDDWEGENPERENSPHWIWYRGQPNATWEPLPAVERPDFIKRARRRSILPHNEPFQTEFSINAQFRRLGASFFDDQADLVKMYFLAQHYGLPTRLLDWTTNPLAALFFAVAGHPNEDGKLFVIKFNQIGTTNLKEPQGERGLDVVATINNVFGEGPKPQPPGIIPVLPALRFSRMLQQGSCFTLHMSDAEKLEFSDSGHSPSSGASAYLIPGGFVKQNLAIQLRRMNVHWASLFPEVDFLVKEIRARFDLPS